jgi:signal transduction histidine kinase
MQKIEIEHLNALIDERNIKLMEREVELAERIEEINAQKEELTAAIDELTFANQQLIDRNNELDQILYKTSHDLISPIISIDGVLKVIKNENIPEQLKVYLHHIEQKNNQMREIIFALNTLARINQNEWAIEKINVSELVNVSLQELSTLPNFYALKLEINIDARLIVEIDKLVLKTVIKNLISNAIIFRKKNQTDGFIKINITKSDSELKIEIIDNGEGILPTIFDKIDEIFYRGSSKSLGMGMGLYITKKIAQRMNGSLKWMCINHNTIFTVNLFL